MAKRAQKIKDMFAGKLVGNAKMQNLVAETVMILPQKTQRFVTKNVWFVASFEDSWGFVLRGDELVKGKFLVFLSDDLFEQDSYSQTYTIIHEIGHVMLGHRNSIMEKQTRNEISQQEKEAHHFALKYLAD